MAQADVRFEQNVRAAVVAHQRGNAADGIRTGDLVGCRTRGTLIAGAVVTDKIMKGVASLEEGSWIQLDSGRCNTVRST